MKGSITREIQIGRTKAEPKRAFYSYALVDSHKLSSLLKRKQTFSLVPDEPGFAEFELFKSTIFYIGKGTNGRKLVHLTQAKMRYLGVKVRGKNTSRLDKIVSLWKNSRGVTILQLDCDATSREAFCREYAMISAIGLHQLNNVQQGKCYGEMNNWPGVKIMNYGDMLLFQLFKQFISRPASPILPSDVVYNPPVHKKDQKFCTTCKRVLTQRK